MGWQDRDYASDQDYYRGGTRRHYRGSGAGALSVTTSIIIANAIIYLMTHARGQLIDNWISHLAVMEAGAVLHGEVWRLFTATYMHANFWHVFVNMLVFYFVGPWLERTWGRRQFFVIYSLAGIAGNVLLTLAGFVGFVRLDSIGLGASGSVMGIFAAAAVLFPHAEVLVYFILPVRLRTVAIVLGIGYVYNVLQRGSNYGGDLCHLAGLAVGAWWAYSGSAWWSGTGKVHTTVGTGKPKSFLKGIIGDGNQPSLRQRIKQRQTDAADVDRILQKVYEQGIHALSPEERRQLSEASQRLNKDEAGAGRVDRL